MEHINWWWIRTATTQKFLKISWKNMRHNWLWRILQPDERQKRNRKEEKVLIIHRASLRWKEFDRYWIWDILSPNSSTIFGRKWAIFFDGELRTIFSINFHKYFVCRMIVGKQKEEVQKRRYQYCTNGSGITIYFRALQGHPGCNLIGLSLQENVFPSGFLQHIYHIESASYLHSMINSVLILGGQNSNSILFACWSQRQKAPRSCKDWLQWTTSRTILAHCLEETSRRGILGWC